MPKGLRPLDICTEQGRHRCRHSELRKLPGFFAQSTKGFCLPCSPRDCTGTAVSTLLFFQARDCLELLPLQERSHRHPPKNNRRPGLPESPGSPKRREKGPNYDRRFTVWRNRSAESPAGCSCSRCCCGSRNGQAGFQESPVRRPCRCCTRLPAATCRRNRWC